MYKQKRRNVHEQNISNVERRTGMGPFSPSQRLKPSKTQARKKMENHFRDLENYQYKNESVTVRSFCHRFIMFIEKHLLKRSKRIRKKNS